MRPSDGAETRRVISVSLAQFGGSSIYPKQRLIDLNNILDLTTTPEDIFGLQSSRYTILAGRVETMCSTMCLASRPTPPNSAELSE